MTNPLVGKRYTFADGNSIEVIQVKDRDEGNKLVTYLTRTGPGIPKKLVMDMKDFLDNYGHLFTD